MRRILLLFLGSIYATGCLVASPQRPDARRELDRAKALEKQSSWREAKAAYESLLPKVRAANDPGALADALSGLSQVDLALGQYQTATPAALEAAQVYAELGRDSERATALNRAGLGHMYLGEFTEALRCYEESLELNRRRQDLPGEVIGLNNVANVYYQQGRYSDAYQTYQQALRRVEETPVTTGHGRARQITIANLAALHQRIGQLDRALELYRDLRASAFELSPSEQARLLTNIGVLYRRLGDPYKALEQYRAARNLFRRDQHHDGEIGAIKNSGIALALDLNDLPRALLEFDAAWKLAESTSNRREMAQAELYRGEVLRRMHRLAEAAGSFQRAHDAATELGANEDRWKALYGLGKVAEEQGDAAPALQRYYLAMEIIEAVRSGLQAGSLRSEFLADKRDVYDAAISVILRQSKPPAETFRLMELGRARSLQDRLRRGLEPAAMDAVAARLDRSTLLLEYWTAGDTLAILWIARGGAGVLRRSISDHLAGVERLVAALEEDAAKEQWREPSRTLGSLLLSGITPLLNGDIRRLLIVPDGPLHALPFEVLETEAGRLLVEQVDVTYLPSASFLLWPKWAVKPRLRLPVELNLIAFGDPEIAEKSPAIVEDLAAEKRLRQSRVEVNAIAALLGRAEVHLGSDAKKQYLTRSVPRAPVVHLATHARAESHGAARSRILFAPASAGDPQDYLFQPEIPSLDLSKVGLVTLSACDTERGPFVPGEGVHSLSRAFLAAGAQSTISTLWRVADGPTAEFMRHFYWRLARGESQASALRQTKLLFLHSGSEFSNPRYWAAFVASGNSLVPALRVVPWSALIVGLALLLMVAAAGWWLNARTERATQRRWPGPPPAPSSESGQRPKPASTPPLEPGP